MAVSNNLRIIAELDSANTITSRYIYTTSENMPEYMVRGGITYRLVTDHLGSLRQVVNTSTGVVVEQIEYDEFGNVLLDTNPGFVPFGFGGGLYDEQTKLVRFGARDYDPMIGRWTTKDPIRFQSTVTNLYEYVANDPINNRDPGGKFDWERVWNRTIRYWSNANNQIAGVAIPGWYTLADAYLKGKSFSDIDWISFGLGVIARGAASMEIGALTGSPGLLGFIVGGMETGFAGAGGALVTSGAAAATVALSFEVGLFIGSAIMAIIDEIWR